jgi:acyl-CoA reductase-like NAD-dependent aldehyde dehydrogenase
MRYDNLIAGEHVGDVYRENRNPSDHSDVIGEYASASAADTESAIDAAVSSRTSWRRLPAGERMRLLDSIGDTILKRSADLGETLSREEGKPLREGIAEATRAGNTFKYFAAQVLQPTGSLFASHRPDTTIQVSHAPVGAVGIITPWNFPLAVPAWKIAPALAYGNTVVFKPADLVPASAWALTQIIHEAGVPDGVFNLVMGRGSVVGDAIAGSDRLDAVSFTGSTSVGTALAQQSIAHGNKRVQVEMGGKNSIVVLDDADLDTAVTAIIDSAFGSTGQRCTATSRIIATPGIHDALVDGLRQRMLELRVGHALDPQTDIGPVASESQLAQDLDYIRIGTEEGAELVEGGSLVQSQTRGNFLRPTLFAGGTSDMRINQEEIFGPVACVIPAVDLDEAIAIANDSRYGLSSGIVTGSQSAITRFTEEIEAGLVSVNASPAVSELHVPFGGVKESGYGSREQGGYAREFYTTVSTRYLTSIR